MSGFTENHAGGTSEMETGDLTMGQHLALARRMLPLVRRIIRDLLDGRQALARLRLEQGRLDRQRRTLPWDGRARRYQLQEELAEREVAVQDVLAELEVLGLELVSPEEGCVGWPVLVRGRRAYLIWRPGQESVRHWQYAGEATLRPVPLGWAEEAQEYAAQAP
jgi:hypothetical protein